MSKKVETRAQVEKKIKRRELWLKALSLFAILILIAGLGVFIYLQTSDEARRQLADPTNVRVEQYGDNYILSFDEVLNASAYRYSINGIEQQVGPNTRTIDITQLVQTPQRYTVSVQAIGDNGYKNSNVVYGNEFAVYKMLEQPVVQIDQYDSKIVWVQVDYADSYEVTVITNNEPSSARTIRVATTELDISDIVVDFTKEYSFTVRALSENEFVNQSAQSVAVNQKLQGRLDIPQNVVYDSQSTTLYWQPVDNAETYTIVLQHGANQEVRYISNTNSYTFSTEDLGEIGAYTTYVYANNVQGTSSSGETIWFLASEQSQEVEFSVYEKLATPTNLQFQINDSLVWFSWDAVPNAMTYVVELLNETGDKFLEYTTTGANEINIERNVVASLGNIIRVHVKANGYGYYTTSDYSEILEVDVSDQYAPVTNVEVIENGKFLTFVSPSTNVSGSINVFANGGYYVKITDSEGSVIYEGTIYSTTLDTSTIFTEAIDYNIEITVNAYGYFEASTPTTASYSHQIFLNAPYNVYFAVNQDTLNVYFSLDRLANNLTLDIGGQIYENILGNGEGGLGHSDKVTNSQDPDTGVYNYILNFSEFYKEYYEVDPLTLAQRFTIKIKAIGDITEDNATSAGYKDSPYSNIATYENRIKLATPQFIKVENLGDENCILYFTQVANASSYLIEVMGVSSGTTYRMTSRLTTVNIYDVISAGNNIITITALGTGYYTDSDPSEENEYFYTAILKAPNDVEVVETEEDGNTHFYVQFTTTRFADSYEIRIKQTHELIESAEGNRDVVIIEGAEFETLDTRYPVGEGITRCDITDYLRGKNFGRFEIEVRAILNQPDVVEQPIIYSDWSETAYYNYYDKQLAPTNLQFDYDTNILTFDGVDTARNGYVVRVNYTLPDGTYSSHEITVFDTQVDLTEEIQSRGGIGEFTISAMTLRVDELFLRNSDWSDSITVQITYTLAGPTNFAFNDTTSEVSWTSDANMQYEYLKIEFSNASISNLVLVEIRDQSFSTSVYNLRSLIRQYGDGFYRFTVQSYSNQVLVYPSQQVQWTYTKYVQLDAPVLVEVTDRNGRVEATFTTVENARSYAIVAKLPTQNDNEWTYVVTNIEDDGSDRITVDIKQGLINFLGANRYDIAVVAEAYDYFTESNRSNVLQYDLWLTFSAPSNLQVINENGTYYAVWDHVPYAVDYTLTVDSRTVSSSVNTNRYDLTEIIGDAVTGHYLIGVRTNATGYYYQSAYTTYDFYLTNALQAPTLTYDEDTYTLTINGQGDGIGYDIQIDYFDSEMALASGIPTSSHTVSRFTGTQVTLNNHMSATGLGIYRITAKELGDNIYWIDSEWSEACTVYYTIPLNALTMFNIDKRDNGGIFEYYVVMSKDSADIYENALVEYNFYEVDSIDATLSLDETPVLTIYSTETEFLVEGLEEAKYYIVVARVLGGYGNTDIYNQYLDPDILGQTLSELAFYTNSSERVVNFSTLGNLLGAPTITSVTMLDGGNLQITFNKSLNAEDYTLIVTRESQSQEIYNAIIDELNENAVIGETSITVTIPTVIGDFTDEFDIYNIILYANAVVNDDDEIVYGQSPNSEFNFEHITTLDAPTVNIEMQSDGTLRISVNVIEFATGYTFEITINDFAQEMTVGPEGYILMGNAQYGRYVVRAKALGDEYHKDSDYGAYQEYLNSSQIGAVEEVRIISNSEDSSLATRIYAEWDAVEGATNYGVRIDKDGVQIGEYETNRTYFDLLSIFSANGYATYTVWVKTNGDGEYILGELEYSAYANYRYKGQFAIPGNLEINMEELPSDLIYTISFETVANAVTYIISFYSTDGNMTLVTQLSLNAQDLIIDGNKASADISDFLDGVEGGEYLVTIKVEETRQNMASEESEPIDFTNYHKHLNPQMEFTQVGETPVLRFSFNNVDFATGFKLSINGVPYLVNDNEIFTYPQVGYLEIYAGYLNIGQNNVFTLTILGDRTYYYLDTIYEQETGIFTFRLTQVDNIFIEQTDYTTIPDGDLSRVLLTFNQVDFADGYQLWIDGVFVQNLEYGLESYDLSSVFAGRIPKVYTVALVATDSVYGLTQSNAREYSFDYTLRFTAPTNIALTDSTMNLTWNTPTNYDSYMNLAQSNSVELGLQEYEVRIYYTSSLEEKLVTEGNITSVRMFNVAEFLSEPGGYRIEVYACANGPFDASLTAATYVYDITIQLDAVQNVRVYQDGDIVRLSFDPVEKKDYQYADQDIYYDIYLNGERIFGISNDLSTQGIDITSYLWGGDNLVYVITKDIDSTHFLDSPRSEVADYNYVKAFIALDNVTVYNDEDAGKQYLRFDRFTVNGLTEEEIQSLTYTVTVYDALTSTLVGTNANMLATVYNSTTAQIDITEFINSQPGTYTISIKVNAYSTQKTTDAGVIMFEMAESIERTITYQHQLHADMLDLSLLVIDIEGNERPQTSGVEIGEMWLSFDVKFRNDYLANADELLYTLMINQAEYFLTIPFSLDLIGQTVTAAGYLVNSSTTVGFSTPVQITSYGEEGNEKVTLSISIVPLLEANGFNIYRTGIINIKARSQEQGFYLASEYQPNFLVYEYWLRYMTPTGLELVQRDDGLHYIKWDEPIHPHINNYYSIIDEFNVTIYSEGVIDSDGRVTDPHDTQGGSHSVDFTPDEIIAEDGYLYYLVEDILFAGHNTISLKCNGSEERLYYESDTITISGQPFIKKLATPEFIVNDLDINYTGNDGANKGVEIVIVNYDGNEDYDQELRQVVNYNREAQYRLIITSQSQGFSSVYNPTEPTYMTYSIDFRVSRSGLVEVLSGNEFVLYNRISFTTNENQGRLHIVWTLAEPGEYTYQVQAIGNDVYYTSDSDFNELVHRTTYNAPDLQFNVTAYHEVNGVESVRSATDTTKITKIVLTWQTELSRFYGHSYTINIVGSYNKGETTSAECLSNIVVTNDTTITFSPTEHSDVFDVITKRPAQYVFSIYSNETEAWAYQGAENVANGSMVYYQSYISTGRTPVTFDYNYLLQINEPELSSVYEVNGKAYIKTKIPDYLLDAQIENRINQIFTTYTILQCDPSYNLGDNTRAQSYTNTRASVLMASSVEGAEEGYYYIDITGRLYPGLNEITFSFNGITDQNFVASDEVVFEHYYVITLDQVTSISTQNIYNSDRYVTGFLISFENVQYNKYFAYLLEINGTQYNEDFHKILLLKVDSSQYVDGSNSNYQYVRCYDVTNGTEIEVDLGEVYLRSQVGGSYNYTRYNYTPAQRSNSYNNVMTFAVLIDGGIPDRYNYQITTLGELNQDGSINEYIDDIAVEQATTSATPNEFSYIMKGTLREAIIDIGVMEGNQFTSSGVNDSNSYLAYVYNNDNPNDSYVYFEYNTSQGVPSNAIDNSNIVLQIRLQDTQALAYSLFVNNISRRNNLNLNSTSQYVSNSSNVILEYNNGQYESLVDGVRIALVDGVWVAYVDLMALNGGVFTQWGQYEIYVRAHNESPIVNDLNENEFIYESNTAGVDSTNKYAGRFDKLLTPQVSYIKNADSDYGYFEITNYSEISGIMYNNRNNITYRLIIQYRLESQYFGENNDIVVDSFDNVNVGVQNGRFIITEEYIKEILDARMLALGTTYIRLYFDVNEANYLWDSEYSNGDANFNYRAYLAFPTFASNESEYRYGSDFTENARNVYSNQDYNLNLRELATNIDILYSMTSTAYVQTSSGWSVVIEVWLNNESQKVKWEIGNFDGVNSENVLTYRNGNYTGFLAEALSKANKKIDIGEYDLNMQIVEVRDSSGNRVDDTQVFYDDTVYTRTFTIKAKLYAPQDIELNLVDERSISSGNIILNNSTRYLSQVIRESTFIIQIERNGSSERTLYESGYNKVTSSLYFSFSSLTNSGTYTASVMIETTGTGSSQYIESSDWCNSLSSWYIPYVLGFYRVNLTVNDSNEVDLNIDLRQATNRETSDDFEGSSLNTIANAVNYEFNLISLSNTKPVYGTDSDIIQMTITGTLDDIVNELNDSFGNLVNNMSNGRNAFLPGSYIIKIKTTEDYYYSGTTYEATNYFYAYRRSGHNTINENDVKKYSSDRTTLNNKNNGFQCIFQAGYQDWDASYVQYLRQANDKSKYGFVTNGGLTELITDNAEQPQPLPFIQYGFEWTLYSDREAGSSSVDASGTTSQKKANEDGVNISLQINDYKSVSYSSKSSTTSNQGIGLMLVVSINYAEIRSDLVDYIEISDNNAIEPEYSDGKLVKAKYSGVKENNSGVAQYEPKQQRLPAPTNISITYDYDDGGFWGTEYRDYDITWSMASNAESVDHYELEGKQSYDYDPTILTEINEGFLDLQTAILAKLGIEWGLFPMGPGGIIGGNYKLTRTNVTGTENGNGDFLYEFHQGKVTAGLDWQWEYYGGLIDSIIDGYRFHNPKTDAWLFCITAISGDPNFADSDEGTGQTSNW